MLFGKQDSQVKAVLSTISIEIEITFRFSITGFAETQLGDDVAWNVGTKDFQGVILCPNLIFSHLEHLIELKGVELKTFK